MSVTRTMCRIMITMPSDLLQRVNEAAACLNFNRSQFIRQAVIEFLEEQRRHELRELLKEGYQVNAGRDLRIAEEFAHADYEAVVRYAPWEE